MYNAILNRLMKQYGKVKGLKYVCTVCKRYSDIFGKDMYYIPAYESVYIHVTANYLKCNEKLEDDIEDIEDNRPAHWYMEDYMVVDVRGCNTMESLYRKLISQVGDLR